MKRFDIKEYTDDIYNLFLAVALIICFVLGKSYGKSQSKEIVKTDTVYVTRTRFVDSEKTYIYDKMIDYRVRFKKVVLAQIMLETGNLKSNIYKSNHNLFGMRYPKGRTTTSIGVKNGYADYESIDDCILDYAIWQTYYCKDIKNEKAYITYLGKVYASDKEYTKKIKQLMTK